MRWTVVVPGGLLPASIAADVVAGAATAGLSEVLARAQCEPAVDFDCGGATHLRWLWRRFGGTGEPVTAPYALQALDEGADRQAQCWHVDPVHFAFAREHLLLAPLDELPAPDEEAALANHLQAALDELAADAGPTLRLHPAQWLLTLARPWSLRTSLLDAALGQPAHEHWPSGADAATWRRLLNDVQMRWHREPANDEREARGRKPINALWLHGGGSWTPLPARPFAAVADDDPVLRGWALASGLPREALHESDAVPPRGDSVSIRRDLLVPAQFEAWGQWLDRLAQLEAALRRLRQACFDAGYDELALVLCGRRQARVVHLRRGDAWKLWRRAPLAPLFAEAT
ncbi:MAG: hypothetical protein MUF32_01150 [Burkholderiaceae bacterium]|jgi:hypothetical protein|nr:hypothetical protein [Burkholderiaceae bacterium]